MFNDFVFLIVNDAINFAINSLLQLFLPGVGFCDGRKILDSAADNRNNPKIENIRFTLNGQIQQYFSLPFNYMDYILKNPKSTGGLQKLYKSCKYFYAKFPIFVFPEVYYCENNIYKCYDKIPTGWKNYQIINIKNNKILWWFSETLLLYNSFDNMINKIFRCTISLLGIGRISIKLAEFEFLVAENTVEEFCFHGEIIGSDENCVSIDIILSKIPNLKKLWNYSESEKYSNESLKKINLLKFNNKLEMVDFHINFVQPDCYPCHFVTFFQKNVTISSKIRIFVATSVSDNFEAEFKTYLDEWLSSYTNGKPDVVMKNASMASKIRIYLKGVDTVNYETELRTHFDQWLTSFKTSVKSVVKIMQEDL